MVRYCIIELSDLQGENEMKKFVSLALAFCMGLALLAGCSSETDNSTSESSASSKAETSESPVSTGENSDTDYESSDASDENSDTNEIINNLENPYASGFRRTLPIIRQKSTGNLLLQAILVKTLKS